MDPLAPVRGNRGGLDGGADDKTWGSANASFCRQLAVYWASHHWYLGFCWIYGKAIETD